MIPDYITINGCEFINTSRARALINPGPDCPGLSDEDIDPNAPIGLPSILCDDCPGLEQWMQDNCGPNRIPLNDVTKAPWYDPNNPLTGQIRGIVGTHVEGVMASRLGTANAVDTTTGTQRQIIIRFAIFANTLAAGNYAMEWIAELFNTTACTPSDCASSRGFDMCGFTDCTRGSVQTENLRTITGLYLVDGPTEPIRIDTWDDAVVIQTSVVLATDSPLIAKPIRDDNVFTFTSGGSFAHQVDLNPDCSTDPDCARDPDDPLADLPPVNSAIPDPLWPTAPYSAIARNWLIPVGRLPQGTAAVRITAYAGQIPLRMVAVSLLPNPFNRTCAQLRQEDDWRCRACDLIVLKYIPRLGTGIVDPLRRIMQVNCWGGATDDLYAWGPEGKPANPPYVHCGGSYCLMISAQPPVADDAYVRVEFQPIAQTG